MTSKRLLAAIGGAIVVLLIVIVIFGGSDADAPEGVVSPNAVAPREDCPGGWSIYIDRDLRFSICHPSTMVLRTAKDAATGSDAAGIAAADSETNAFGVALHWAPKATGSPEGTCIGASDPSPFAGDRVEDLTIAGYTAKACITEAYRDEAKTQLGYMALAYERPVTDGGVVSVMGIFDGPDVAAERQRIIDILNTLRVR